MRTPENQPRRNEDGVEVVAAEGDDGSFELHVTRTGANPATPPRAHAPVHASESVADAPTASGGASRSPRASRGAIVVAAIALGGLVTAGLVLARGGDEAPPPSASTTVAPPGEEDTGFRVFHIQQPVVQTVRHLNLDLDAGIDLGVPEQDRVESDAGALAPRVAGPQASPEDLPAIGDDALDDGTTPPVLEARDQVEVRHLDELTIERLRQVQVEIPVDPEALVLPEDEWDEAVDDPGEGLDDE